MIFQRFSVLVCFLVPPVFYGQHAFAANPVVARVGEKLRSSSTRLRIEKYPTSLTNSSAREFPWLVTVHANSGDSCVGALLSSQWALIPAHCGFRISQQLTSTNVVAGSSSHRLYPKNSTVQIERVINHPEFETVDPGSANNDLSLIKLVRPLAVDNQTIKAACLFKTEEERTKPFDDLVVSAFRFKNVPDHWRLMKSNFSDRSFDSNCYQLDNLQLIKAKGLNHSYCLGMHLLGQSVR